jgi:hypothetical protein
MDYEVVHGCAVLLGSFISREENYVDDVPILRNT